jgi:hypothetical protein
MMKKNNIMGEKIFDELYEEFMKNDDNSKDIIEFVEFLKERYGVKNENKQAIIDREPVYGC